MILLPNARDAVIEDAKIRDYLLSSNHPVGRFKAKFFRRLGYRVNKWETLRNDLLEFVQSHEAVMSEEIEYGTKYEVCGRLEGPSGVAADITTVWIIRTDESVPRFVTAYPTQG